MDFKKNPPKIASIIPSIKIKKSSKSNAIKKKNIITSMSFHEDGQYCYISSSLDNRVRMVDCLTGSSSSSSSKENMNSYGIQLKKDGARIVEATHHNYSVLISGTPSSKITQLEQDNNINNYVINYVSLHDNQILRTYHTGHSNEITNISLCPIDDRFLSSSLDGTIRLWTLDSAACLAKMDMITNTNNVNNDVTYSTPYGIFDSTGLVFAILSSSSSKDNKVEQHHIHLYDSRNCAVGAFSEFIIKTSTLITFIQGTNKVKDNNIIQQLCIKQSWIHLSFNNDGTLLLITSYNKNIHWIIDGYDGSVKQCLIYPNLILTKNAYDDSDPMVRYTMKTAVFTQDDKYVISIHPNNYNMYIWDASVGTCIHILENNTTNVNNGLRLNPKYALMVTAYVDAMLWIW